MLSKEKSGTGTIKLSLGIAEAAIIITAIAII